MAYAVQKKEQWKYEGGSKLISDLYPFPISPLGLRTRPKKLSFKDGTTVEWQYHKKTAWRVTKEKIIERVIWSVLV
jgi:hypothetical protein